MITKIIACGDIHFPSYSEKDSTRLEKMKNYLQKFIDKCKDIIDDEDSADNVRIVIAGDIVDSKITISNELICAVNWFFTELDKLCKTIVFAGNHDFLMNNMDRTDSLTPLFEIGNYKQVIFLDKELKYQSGIYDDDDISWCLYSSFSGFNSPDIKMHKEAHSLDGIERAYVGLIHTDVNGAITVTNYVAENGIDPKVFGDCDFVIAGHIHKRQEIKKDGVKIVYCSSIRQNNFGESITGHGFVVWDVEDKDDIEYDFVDIKDEDGGYFKFEINSIEDIDNDEEELINY